MLSRKRWLVSGFLSLAAMVLMFSWTMAQEPKKEEAKAAVDEKKAEDKKEDEKKADEPVPAYFKAENDPKKPATWPDPTGIAAGAAATPAADGKGDKNVSKM